MIYDKLMEMLDGHSFAFYKNAQGEATTVVMNPSGWIKVETVRKDGSFTREIYYADGRKENENDSI